MKDYHYISKLLRKLKVELPSHLQCMHIKKFAAKMDIQANCANKVCAFVIRRTLLRDVTVHRRFTSELSMPVAVLCK